MLIWSTSRTYPLQLASVLGDRVYVSSYSRFSSELRARQSPVSSFLLQDSGLTLVICTYTLYHSYAHIAMYVFVRSV